MIIKLQPKKNKKSYHPSCTQSWHLLEVLKMLVTLVTFCTLNQKNRRSRKGATYLALPPAVSNHSSITKMNQFSTGIRTCIILG